MIWLQASDPRHVVQVETWSQVSSGWNQRPFFAQDLQLQRKVSTTMFA